MLLTEDSEIDIFVASKIGSFKHVKYHTASSRNSKKCVENLVDVKSLQKGDSITCMEWGNGDQTEVMLGRANQEIQIYNTEQRVVTKTYTADFATGHVVGLGRCKRKVLAALSSGVVKIWSRKEESVVDTGGKLDCMRLCGDDPSLFATGGEENDLKVYRIGESNPIFSAKNLPHDWLQLRRPTAASDVTFLPGGGQLVAVCSRHGYVRLYDTRAQRRPVINVDFEMAATCIAPSFDERQVLVGFGRGQLHQVDLSRGKRDKGFKGAAGAVTQVTVVPGHRLVVSTSLDRHLRVHRFDTKELVYQQYLTSKLSKVLVQTTRGTPLLLPPETQAGTKLERDDMDDLFDNMDTVCDEPKRKSEAVPAKKAKHSTDPEEAIRKLLKQTEKTKKIREQKKREKKAKSVFHNA